MVVLGHRLPLLEARAAELAVGVGLFSKGVAFIAARRVILLKCFRHSPEALAAVVVGTLIIQCFSYPLQLFGVTKLEWFQAMELSAVLALSSLRLLLPEYSGQVFFAVLTLKDEKLCERVKQMPVLYGIRYQITNMAMGAGLGIVAFVVFSVIFFHVVVLWWFWMIVLPVLLVLVLIGAFLGLISSIIAPFIKLWNYCDPLIAILAVAMIVCGATSRESVTYMFAQASMLYYASTFLTLEFLAQYSQRQDKVAWIAFKKRHRFHCLGFGLPIWAAFKFQPIVAICLLQGFAGAAASLLADLMKLDEAQGK